MLLLVLWWIRFKSLCLCHCSCLLSVTFRSSSRFNSFRFNFFATWKNTFSKFMIHLCWAIQCMSNFFCCFSISFNSFCMNRLILFSIYRIVVILLYSFRLVNGRRKISLSNFCMPNLLLIRNNNFLSWILLNNWFSSFLLNLMMRWNVIAVLNLPSIWRSFSLHINSLPRNNNSLPLWKN